MIVTAKNISRDMFNRLNFCAFQGLTNQTYAYISLYGNDEDLGPPKINEPLWHSGIQLCFDDVEADFPDKKLFKISAEQSDKIVNYLEFIHGEDLNLNLIIHCYAGVSRSAGVGMFVNDIFKLGLPNYCHLKLYNRFVYRELINSWIRT
jgi:hypothetical protein